MKSVGKTAFRRLQRLGGGSLFLSVPHVWVLSNGLKKGSLVSIDEAPDGSLIIRGGTPSPGSTIYAQEIDAEQVASDDFWARFYGVYLSGADIVNVRVFGAASDSLRTKVREAAKRLPGLELADEGQTTMTFRFMLDISAMKPDHLIRRISSISSALYTGAFETRDSGRGLSTVGIEQKMSDMNRLNALASRVLSGCEENAALSAELGIPPASAAEYMVVLGSLKKIGEIGAELCRVVGSKMIAGSGGLPNVSVENLKILQDSVVQTFLTLGKDAYGLLNRCRSQMMSTEVSIWQAASSLEACLLHEIEREITEIAECSVRLRSRTRLMGGGSKR
jgi:phosphate uptake regulator